MCIGLLFFILDHFGRYMNAVIAMYLCCWQRRNFPQNSKYQQYLYYYQHSQFPYLVHLRLMQRYRLRTWIPHTCPKKTIVAVWLIPTLSGLTGRYQSIHEMMVAHPYEKCYFCSAVSFGSKTTWLLDLSDLLLMLFFFFYLTEDDHVPSSSV